MVVLLKCGPLSIRATEGSVSVPESSLHRTFEPYSSSSATKDSDTVLFHVCVYVCGMLFFGKQTLR
jgi:hypothetical protein